MSQLSANHKRAISSTLFLLEKMAEEIVFTFNKTDPSVMQETVHDLDDSTKAAILQTLQQIKQEIEVMAERYQLQPQKLVESHFVNARKSKAWEMLHNTKAKQLNAFGKFPPELEPEFDAGLEKLLKLIEKI